MVRNLGKRDAYSIFELALRAPETRRQWPRRFDVFLTFLELDGLDVKERVNQLYDLIHKESNEWLQNQLLEFIDHQKERVTKGEISESTISNYIKPVKTFCDMNDILVNWKIISKCTPKGRRAALDRPPTYNEIIKLLSASDIRIKPIVLVMSSSGIRVGAWDELRWKHVTPLKDKNDDIVAAKITIYPGDEEEYYTFITLEAYNALKEWMNLREKDGEHITGNSWLMRDIWQVTDLPKHGGPVKFANNPQKLGVGGIKNIIYRALRARGIISKLDEQNGEKRHEFKMMNGFRKLFKTQCEKSGMKSINIELLMGHNIGVAESYYKPTEKEVFEDYLNAVDNLTINEENKLKIKNKELENKLNNRDQLINEQLAEKEKRLNNMEQKYENDIKNMKEEMDNKLDKIMSLVQQNPKLANIKPKILESI